MVEILKCPVFDRISIEILNENSGDFSLKCQFLMEKWLFLGRKTESFMVGRLKKRFIKEKRANYGCDIKINLMVWVVGLNSILD